jgi:hypothetical protein
MGFDWLKWVGEALREVPVPILNDELRTWDCEFPRRQRGRYPHKGSIHPDKKRQ